MTQYLLSVHVSDAEYSSAESEDAQVMYAQVEVFNQELRDSGVWVFAGGLHPSSTAKIVSAQDGKTVTTDGPYMKTEVHIGGFWIINVPDLESALAWAAKGSAACEGPVEVRPFQSDLNHG